MKQRSPDRRRFRRFRIRRAADERATGSAGGGVTNVSVVCVIEFPVCECKDLAGTEALRVDLPVQLNAPVAPLSQREANFSRR